MPESAVGFDPRLVNSQSIKCHMRIDKHHMLLGNGDEGSAFPPSATCTGNHAHLATEDGVTTCQSIKIFFLPSLPSKLETVTD
jgi:hypothetical protein